MTDSRNFDLKNYRRLEKFNNRVNIASTILFLLALISLPVTFFSLDATRSDDVVFGVITKPVEIDTLSYFVYFTPQIIFPNQTLIFGEALKGERWQLTFGLWRKENEYDSEIQRTVEIDASLPVAIRMQFGTNPLDGSVQQLLAEYDAACDRRHPFVNNVTDTIHVLSLCFPHVPDLDSYRIMIVTNSTQRYKRFFSGYLSTDIYFQHPRTVLTSTLPCEGVICFQSFSATTILTRSGEVKRQTSQAVMIDANSPRFTFTNSYNDFVESLIYLMLQYPYSGDTSIDPNRQIFTDNRYPNTLAISVLQEQPKYSTGDTVIDSFAISAIIVSGVLLAVTLAKLVLWMVFNPVRGSS